VQADAAVLHSTLSQSRASSSSSQRWLLDAAQDVVELSLMNATHYTCAASVWHALAGCGHPLVSASLIAAAADLTPLSDAAAQAVDRLLHSGGGALQQLQASLQLPNPDAVALDSAQHAVYAIDAAGWLHQQLMRAAGEGVLLLTPQV
jgi:hypothetical protein